MSAARDSRARAEAAPAPLAKALRVDGTRKHEPLRECVREALEHYFATLDGHGCGGLYDLVMSEVEAPLIATVLAHAGGNQSKAAAMLGISRGTLRSKIRKYGIDT